MSESDKATIDELVRRFFASFTNRGGARPDTAGLARLFAPGAAVVCGTAAQPEVVDVQSFIAPREALLTGGRLVEFEEHETSERTEIFGNVAQRWSEYEKSGVLDGAPFSGKGRKSIQLVKTSEGWKITALAWDDA